MSARRTVLVKDSFRHPLWLQLVNAGWRMAYHLGAASSLKKDDLIRAARKATGLTDLGKDFDDEPLERLLISLKEEARLNPLGRFISRQRIINLLMVRLRAEYWFKKHPEILNLDMLPVWMIIGLQRTGTTKLHRLLTADPENRVLASWEAINPAPLNTGFPQKDKRPGIARRSEKALKIISPGFFAVHPVEHAAPEEDILLLDVSFLSTTPEATLHVPTYARWLEGRDQSPAYEYAGKLLRLLQWQQPGRRWVLKSPHHLEFLPLVEKHYGASLLIWTHRDLTACIPSFLSMLCHARSIFSNEVRISEVTGHWIRKTGYMLNKALAYRQGEHAGKFIDIHYDLLVKDYPGQLSRIYEGIGGMTEDLTKRFEVSAIENPQWKYGFHDYSPGDFGLDPEVLIDRNRDYHGLFFPPSGRGSRR
jgi:hypothetical protein